MNIHYYRPTYVAMALACAAVALAAAALGMKGLAEGRPGPPIAMAGLLTLLIGGIACHAAWIAWRANLPAVAFDADGIAFPIFGIGRLGWSGIRSMRVQSLLGRNELFIHFHPPAPRVPAMTLLFGGFWRGRRAGHFRFNMKRMNCGRDSLDLALQQYCPPKVRDGR